MAFVGGPEQPGCLFCRIEAETDRDEQNFVVHRARHNLIVLNIYPYISGHLMIVPYEHTAEFDMLPAETAAEIMRLGQRCTHILTETMQPHGFNLGMNLGRVAGAGIDEHLHLHVVPRWNGDTNFLPLIGGVKLVPEAIDDTYAALQPHFAGLNRYSEEPQER